MYYKLDNIEKNGWDLNTIYNCKCGVYMGSCFYIPVLNEPKPQNATLTIYNLSFCECNPED